MALGREEKLVYIQQYRSARRRATADNRAHWLRLPVQTGTRLKANELLTGRNNGRR